MTTRKHPPQVGAPDPEKRTSPILDPLSEDDPLSLDAEIESGACYFNDARFAIGDTVRCGHELLQCDDRGVWTKIGEED